MRCACLLLVLAGVGVAHGQSCPSPYPNARCDVTAISLPSVPPQVGPNTCTAGVLNQCGNLIGAGTVITDPNFSNTIMRLTDTVLNSIGNGQYRTNETTSSGSGDEMLFSCDSSMIVVDNSGSWHIPMNFFGVSSVPARMYGTTLSASNGMYFANPSALTWGHNCPSHAHFLYGLCAGACTAPSPALGTELGHYDFTGNTPSGTPPTFTVDYDFQNCLPANFTVTYASSSGGSTLDDNDFAVTLGGGPDWVGSHIFIAYDIILPQLNNSSQNAFQTTGGTSSGSEPNWATSCSTTCTDGSVTWTNIGKPGQGGNGTVWNLVWRKTSVSGSGSGCRLLRSDLGQVTYADWGSTGSISGTSCFQPTNNGGVHNSKIFKGGGINGALLINLAAACSDGNGSPYVWLYSGLTYEPETPGASSAIAKSGGHWTEGLTTFVNNAGDSAPFYEVSRTLSTLSSPVGLVPSGNMPSGGIQSGLDNHCGWNSLNDTWPVLCSTHVTGTTVAWSNEIDGFNLGVGAVYRFANTEATNANPDFSTSNAIGSVSQDGKWYMFTSDWQSTLGSTSGVATCTTGSGGDCRGEVFVVALNSGPPASLSTMFAETMTSLGFLGLVGMFCAIKNSRRIHR